PRPACGRRQALAVHAGEIHPTALEKISVLDDARFATPAFRALPAVVLEPLAVDSLQLGRDATLEIDEVVVDFRRVHRFGETARNPMSLRYCIPSKWTPDTASYARRCASLIVWPSAVTHSTRPPEVTVAPSATAVPEWNTRRSSSGAGSPVIASPFFGESG